MQIGEISLMKEMTSVATTMMSEEEKAEMEKEMGEGRGFATPSPSVTTDASSATAAATQPTFATSPNSTGASPIHQHSGALTPSSLVSPGETSEQSGAGGLSALQEKEAGKDRKRKSKLTLEQKKKLQELEEERRKNMEERVESLTKKLIERLRPFVEAKHPGEKDDPETKLFEDRMKREADDMKLESFGVEVCSHPENEFIQVLNRVLSSYIPLATYT